MPKIDETEPENGIIKEFQDKTKTVSFVTDYCRIDGLFYVWHWFFQS